MSSDATLGVEAHARKRPRERDAAAANGGEVIPRLPNHLVVEHILRSENFDDPSDLARLPVVSRAMRDAVAATGLRFADMDMFDAAKFGCLATVKRLLRRCGAFILFVGDEILSLNKRCLCAEAAKSGQLALLKWARANGCQWDEFTCAYGALGGHLEVLKWLRANGCPWGEKTCSYAAEGGHLQVLQWAHANGCPPREEQA